MVIVPMEVERAKAMRCDICGRLIKEPLFVKTCCNNKPKAFCSRQCYDRWKREWLRNQEQIVGRSRAFL